MLIKFNSGHNREANSIIVSVQIPRPLRILESGEIRPLFSFRKAVFYPSPLLATQRPCNYCSDTIVATRNGLCYFCSSLIPILSFSVVIVATTVVVVFHFGFSAKMAVSDVSQKYDVILRKFKKLKHQNILAFTVWLIVPITLLIFQNC